MKHFEMITSYEDACAYLGEDPENLPNMTGPDAERIINTVKLERITRAINKSETFDLYETIYFPYTYFYSKQEYERELKDGRTDLIPCTGPIAGLGAHARSGSVAGLACLTAYGRVSVAVATWGFRLCFKEREACEHAIRHFSDLYNSLL